MHLEVLARELPLFTLAGTRLQVAGATERRKGPVALDAATLLAGADPRLIDRAMPDVGHGDGFVIELEGLHEPASLARAALLVATRLQRWIDRRNDASRSPVFDRVLDVHRSMHDLSKPLVRADWEHALDTWQWLLRLDPDAGMAPQVAALMHDIERLVSEADARIEHLASDYDRFKDAHARAGAERARTELVGVGLAPATIDRVAWLVSAHERAGAGELALLNAADALSFFSLISPGFADYFGVEHTRRKVGWTLKRLSPRQRCRLDHIHLRADIRALVDELSPAPRFNESRS